MGEDIEKAKISLKTAVVIVVTIVGWVISLACVYFPMASKVNDGNIRIGKLEANFDKYNFSVLDYKM